MDAMEVVLGAPPCRDCLCLLAEALRMPRHPALHRSCGRRRPGSCGQKESVDGHGQSAFGWRERSSELRRHGRVVRDCFGDCLWRQRGRDRARGLLRARPLVRRGDDWHRRDRRRWSGKGRGADRRSSCRACRRAAVGVTASVFAGAADDAASRCILRHVARCAPQGCLRRQARPRGMSRRGRRHEDVRDRGSRSFHDRPPAEAQQGWPWEPKSSG